MGKVPKIKVITGTSCGYEGDVIFRKPSKPISERSFTGWRYVEMGWFWSIKVWQYGNSMGIQTSPAQNFTISEDFGTRSARTSTRTLLSSGLMSALSLSTFSFLMETTHGKLPSSCHIQKPLILIAKNWDWHRFTSSSTSSSSRKWSKAGFLVNIHIIHYSMDSMELNDLRSSLTRLNSDSTSLVHQQCPAQRTCIPPIPWNTTVGSHWLSINPLSCSN